MHWPLSLPTTLPLFFAFEFWRAGSSIRRLLRMPSIKLDLTHNLLKDQRWMELRFDTEAPMDDVKNRVSRHTGSSASHMVLHKDHANGEIIDAYPNLETANVKDGMTLFVEDQDPQSILKSIGGGTKEGTAGAFQLTDEQYGKRSGTAREFLSQLKQKRPDLFQKNLQKVTVTKALEPDTLPFPLNSRCQIKQTQLRGSIAWVGEISDAMKHHYVQVSHGRETNIYCGVKLDSPVGNFNGVDPETKTVLFECDCPSRALLIHIDDIETGDQFSPLDTFELDEI
eukprot:Protomagalhaensia_wolfi_Nauph_80__3015@NODE_308_length_2840_cov_551_307033_g231_i0_p1_GENE_NODE_308_length_2840_cov_551_307033_g231_i0NODE_308_length_2840_cov_551_307033_g231_i0_p1_ORF_typecomplete_len283_score55_10Ubiquitin_2/PF14560_6/1_2e08CAP_GLY/PF01302_25/7_1e03CAP_GLY/PF01302_25/6_7e06Cobl/PF09469_10/0_035Tfb5/PF06331_12/6_8e03Tfb5/PF06331_12/0_21DUF733/PF05306_11/0_14P2/PF07194_11/4_2e03P2/PF07194_11/0_5_NODE_308_length_2840_cov_551_307033_g231_i02931141